MSTTTINIRVDSDIKQQAQRIFGLLGMDMSTAINVFLRQAIRDRSIPFKITDNVAISNPTKEDILQPGCLKGRIWMSNDFDEPLEDFKEYM